MQSLGEQNYLSSFREIQNITIGVAEHLAGIKTAIRSKDPKLLDQNTARVLDHH